MHLHGLWIRLVVAVGLGKGAGPGRSLESLGDLLFPPRDLKLHRQGGNVRLISAVQEVSLQIISRKLCGWFCSCRIPHFWSKCAALRTKKNKGGTLPHWNLVKPVHGPKGFNSNPMQIQYYDSEVLLLVVSHDRVVRIHQSESMSAKTLYYQDESSTKRETLLQSFATIC